MTQLTHKGEIPTSLAQFTAMQCGVHNVDFTERSDISPSTIVNLQVKGQWIGIIAEILTMQSPNDFLLNQTDLRRTDYLMVK